MLYEHADMLGRKLTVGCHVAVAHANSLVLATVEKLGPKLVICNDMRGCGLRKYSSDMTVIDGPQLTLYLLRNTNFKS